MRNRSLKMDSEGTRDDSMPCPERSATEHHRNPVNGLVGVAHTEDEVDTVAVGTLVAVEEG